MHFTIQRETLLKPLQSIMGVVEKKHTMAVLANVLIEVNAQQLKLTSTDIEIEMIAIASIETAKEDGNITVPGRKLVDICRSLPDESALDCRLEKNNRLVVRSGKSRFVLSTLPANEFPSIQGQFSNEPINLQQKQLLDLLQHTYFAMAQQDVRYFLNGMLLAVNAKMIRVVATDGHRLAMSTIETGIASVEKQVIVPRKAILELMRLLDSSEEPVQILFGDNHLRIIVADFTFTTKLIEGRYPDYKRVIPAFGQNVIVANRENLKQALALTAILSNDKYRGVRMNIETNRLGMRANNPEQEEAEDELTVAYEGEPIEIGFNINYLIDVLNIVKTEDVHIYLANANSSAVIQEQGDCESLYVIMPIRL